MEKSVSLFTCLVKGSQMIRRNVACYITQLGLTYRKFISHWCLMVQRRTTSKLLRYWMIILFQKLMYLLKDICFGKSVRVVRKGSINLFAGSDNEPLRVSLESGKMSTSRDQLIDKCYSARLRRKCLEKEGSVTLNDLLVTARAQEAVNLRMEAMGANNSSGQVNAVVDDGARGGDISSEQVSSVVDVSGGTSSGKRNCFNCGRKDHFSRDRRCPARGRKCDQCVEIGH